MASRDSNSNVSKSSLLTNLKFESKELIKSLNNHTEKIQENLGVDVGKLLELNDPESLVSQLYYHLAQCTKLVKSNEDLYGTVKNLLRQNLSRNVTVHSKDQNQHQHQVVISDLNRLRKYLNQHQHDISRESSQLAIENLVFDGELQKLLKNTNEEVNETNQTLQHRFKLVETVRSRKLHEKTVEVAEIEYVQELVMKFSTLVQVSRNYLVKLFNSLTEAKRMTLSDPPKKVVTLTKEQENWLNIIHERLPTIPLLLNFIKEELPKLRSKLSSRAMKILQGWIEANRTPIQDDLSRLFSGLQHVLEFLHKEEIINIDNKSTMKKQYKEIEELVKSLKHLTCPKSSLPVLSIVPSDSMGHSYRDVLVLIASDLAIYRSFIERFDQFCKRGELESCRNLYKVKDVDPISLRIRGKCEILIIVTAGFIICLEKLGNLEHTNGIKASIEKGLKDLDLSGLSSTLYQHVKEISCLGISRAKNEANVLEPHIEFLDSMTPRLVTFTVRLQLLIFAASSETVLNGPEPPVALEEYVKDLKIDADNQHLTIPSRIVDAALKTDRLHKSYNPIVRDAQFIWIWLFNLLLELQIHDTIFAGVLEPSEINLGEARTETPKDIFSKDHSRRPVFLTNTESSKESYVRGIRLSRSRAKTLLIILYMIEQKTADLEEESLKTTLPSKLSSAIKTRIEELHENLLIDELVTDKSSDSVMKRINSEYRGRIEDLNKKLKELQKSLVKDVLEDGSLETMERLRAMKATAMTTTIDQSG